MKCTIIGIAGGTSSGKTTIAKKIYEQSKKYGSVIIIRLDDYYKDLSNLAFEERLKVNYDHPDSYDVDLFVKHIIMLKQGNSINKPNYDFVNHNRSKETDVVNPANVIIIEGILLFAIPRIKNLFDIKIYVETPDDIRFIRRLKRDTAHRGRSVESVIHQYLSTVRPMHMMFVEPSKQYADLIVPEGGQNSVAINVIVTKILDILKDNCSD